MVTIGPNNRVYRTCNIGKRARVYRKSPEVYRVYGIYGSLSHLVYFWAQVLSGLAPASLL